MAYLEVRDLYVTMRTPTGFAHAIDGIDLSVERGEIFGLLGESGSGKTTVLLSLIGLLPPHATAMASQMSLGELDLLSCDWRQVRGRRVAMIFQHAGASLNPVFTIGHQLGRVLQRHTSLGRAERCRRALELLGDVGLPSSPSTLGCYPHELSGGMQQRVMIALALASGAELLLADEPTSALDPTIQAQIVQLLLSLRERQQLTIMLVTHDFGLVAQSCDRVGVLYAGRVAEVASAADIFAAPRHPYTQALLESLPRMDGGAGRPVPIEGAVPLGDQRPQGCAFAPRCRFAFERCIHEQPPLKQQAAGHWAACHLHDVHGR